MDKDILDDISKILKKDTDSQMESIASNTTELLAPFIFTLGKLKRANKAMAKSYSRDISLAIIGFTHDNLDECITACDKMKNKIAKMDKKINTEA